MSFADLLAADPLKKLGDRLTAVARAHGPEAGVAALLCLLAYGPYLFSPTLAGDDWQVLAKEGFQEEWVVQIGRWMQGVLWKLFERNAFAPAFTGGVMVGLWLAAGVLALRCLGLERRSSRLVFLGGACLFPVLNEPVSFEMFHLAAGLGVFLAVAAGALSWRAMLALADGQRARAAGSLLVGAGALSLAATCYQPTAAIALMVPLLAFLGAVLRGDPVATERGQPVRLWGVLAALAGTGIALYALHVLAAQAIAGVEPVGEGRYGPSLAGNLEEASTNLDRFTYHFVHFLFSEQYLIPRWTKLVFVAACAALAIALAMRASGAGRSRGALIAAAGALGSILLLPWLLGILRNPYGYRYNALISLPYCYAGVCALGIDGLRLGLVRGVLAVAAFCALGNFVFQHNLGWSTGHFSNRRDLAVAARILDRAQQTPGYEEAARDGVIEVLVVGRQDRAGRPFRVYEHGNGPNWNSIGQTGVLNGHPWRLSYVFNLLHTDRVTFRRHGVDPPDLEEMSEIVAEMSAWPKPGSVRFVDGTLVVLLRQPTRYMGAARRRE